MFRRCCDLCETLGPRDPSKELPEGWARLTFSRPSHDAQTMEMCPACGDFVQTQLIETLAQVLDEKEGSRAT